MSFVSQAVAAVVLWSCPPLLAQDPLAPPVIALLDEALASQHPEQAADRLWQAAAAAHGGVEPLLATMRARIADSGDAGASRLLSGILRYQGRPDQALTVLARIPAASQIDGDLLLRAELLDTVGRGSAAAKAYEELLQRDLDPPLRRRILFRRALVGSDSIDQLKQFAASPDNDRDQRNQAAIILALRNQPQAALELYQVQGESTARFRQLIRLAEWALAAENYERAQEFAWQAVSAAKMRRDQRYALTVVVSAYRAGDAIDALLQRFEASPELRKDARQVWIDLLRDEGRVEDALRLFRQKGEGEWTPQLRRQLLEICRETGRDDVLVSQFRELMAAEPDNLQWRSGLSRHWLESGDREQAKAAWQDFGGAATSPQRQLEAAYALMDLGLDELSLKAAKVAVADAALRETAQMFVVKLHVERGRFELAVEMLAEIEGTANGRDAVLAEVAGIYERIDRLDRAVAVLDRMREAFGGFLGTDLDMKYALLLSKVDREQDALKVWRSLWSKVRSTPRGRYVEDRMMTVAARLGVLAKIAIELEDRLDAGTADTTDVELLVRLYVKVGDSAAATEITEQALRNASADDLEILRKKATIYLACNDYVEYEALIEQLIERDPENRLDHMRELTLSRLERGRRAQAIEKLPALRAASDDGGIADEFEAGIYQLAGLKEQALQSYLKGLGRFPDRIDTHLLVANLMRETGREMEAARRFQYLASTAVRDDLFTIAIDGILNLRAQDGTTVPISVVDWAMRVTLERLAERSHRFYLHRLAADLAEEMNDLPMAIRTLTAGIPVAGERRTALLREILGKIRSLDKNARVTFGGSRGMKISDDWDPAPYVMVGRRLLGQGEVVPPQVYMDLAAVFLKVDAVPDAMRTFSRAAELLDRGEVHRQAAVVLEQAERYDAALQFYRRLLSVDADDVALLAKIGRLEEFAGRDAAACGVYQQGLAAALRQTATRVHIATEQDEGDPNDIASIFAGQRNVDALQATLPKFVEGLLVTLPAFEAHAFLTRMKVDVERELAQVGAVDKDKVETIDQYPRLAARADALRRLSLCFRHLSLADPVDRALLARFPTDRALAKATIGYRADRGFHLAATDLVRGSSFTSDPDFGWLLATSVPEGSVSPSVAAARVVTMLVEQPAQLRAMLDDIDTAAIDPSNLDVVPVLLGACTLVGAVDAGERIARAGVRIAASMSERARIVQSRRSGTEIIRLATRIDPDLRQRLVNYRVQRTAAQGAKALVSLRYEIEGESGFQLDVEAIETMLRREVANSAGEQLGLRSMSLLHFLPTERRAPLLRELYTAAPARQRLNLLAEGADFVPEPISDDYLKWYAAVFERELADADKTQRRRAAIGYSQVGSKRLMRLRLEALRKFGGSHRDWLRLLGIVVEIGDRDGARQLLEKGIPDMLTRDDLAGVVPNRPKGLNKRQVEQAVDQIAALGLQQQAAAIVADQLATRPRHEALRYIEWLLRTRLAGASEFVRQTIAAAPDDVDLLERLYRFQQQRGRLVEARETLERLVELDEKKARSWRSQIARLHSQLGNPEAAAAIRESNKAAAPSARAGSSRVAVALQSFVVSNVRPQPSGRVGALTRLDDPEKARLGLRRLWRGRGDDRRVYSPFVPRVNLGISAKDLEGLEEAGFVREEALRMLRLLEDAGQLGGQSLAPVLLRCLPASGEVAAATKAVLDALREGRGGTLEVERLLIALDVIDLDEDLQADIVALLLARREAPDKQRLRRIADELVGMERTAEAASLYRLAELASGEGNVYIPPNRRQKPGEVIANVQRRLGEEHGRSTAVAMIDDQLAVLQTPDVMLSALQAWPELLPAEQLEARVLALHQQVQKLRGQRLGGFAFNNTAVPLAGAFCEALVRAGQLELAMTEFAQIVRAPTSDAYGRVPRRNETVVRGALESLLALDVSGGPALLRAIGEATVDWQQRGVLATPATTLGLVGTKLAEAGENELAGACAEALTTLAPDDTRAEQRLAYLRRALGDEVGALTLERKLLAQRRLAVADHARVLRSLRARDGAEQALAAGETALGYTTDTAFLTAMAKLAEEVGQVERAGKWREQIEQRKPKPAPTEPNKPASRR